MPLPTRYLTILLLLAGLGFTATANAQSQFNEKIVWSFYGALYCNDCGCYCGTWDVSEPESGVVFNSSGTMFGTSQSWGYWPNGGVFSLAPNGAGGWTEATNQLGGLGEFTPPSGFTIISGEPWGAGGIDVVEWSGNGEFYHFPSDVDPIGGVLADASGLVYGVSGGYGGGGYYGGVYKLNPANDAVTVLYTFTGGSDGGCPAAKLLFDSQGNLYGVAGCGGNAAVSCSDGALSGCGVVFRLSPTAGGPWKETVLYAFKGGADGGFPDTGLTAGLTWDVAGNLYGTAPLGGSSGYGVVYKLTPTVSGPWKETVLHAFNGGSDGADPSLSYVTFDAAGNLYSTTSSGGTVGQSGFGTAFELTPIASGSWSETILHSFGAYAGDGAGPMGGVVFGPGGSLYGTTQCGGIQPPTAIGCGTVFELSPAASSLISTTTAVTSSSNPATLSQPVTLTAKLGPTIPLPGGTVAFISNNTPITGCTAVAVSPQASAICTTTSLGAGIDSITAVYSGDSKHKGSAGGILQHIENTL